jgi:hypothetical protein
MACVPGSVSDRRHGLLEMAKDTLVGSVEDKGLGWWLLALRWMRSGYR